MAGACRRALPDGFATPGGPMIDEHDTLAQSVVRRSNRLEPVASLAERIGPHCPACGGATSDRLVMLGGIIRHSESVCLTCETVTARRWGPTLRASIEVRGEGAYVAGRLLRGERGAPRLEVVCRGLFARNAIEEGRGALGGWIHGILGQLAALFTLPELRR